MHCFHQRPVYTLHLSAVKDMQTKLVNNINNLIPVTHLLFIIYTNFHNKFIISLDEKCINVGHIGIVDFENSL